MLIGEKHNRLTAIEYVSGVGITAKWRFLCDCGAELLSTPHRVQTSNTKSCGCLKRESSAKTGRSSAGKPNLKNRKTGLSDTDVYGVAHDEAPLF